MNAMHEFGLSAAVVLLLATGGCGNAGPPPNALEVRKDAAEGAKREAEARMDATYDREQVRKHALEAQAGGAPADPASTRNAALASAEATYAAAVLRCDAQTGESRTPCRERADSELASAKARANSETSLPRPKS